MNILSTKSWHVRNQNNKERVRKDEENARLEEKKEQERIDFAEQEARLRLLRKRNNLDTNQELSIINSDGKNQHINLFEIEENAGDKGQKKDNKEYIKEKNAEKEIEQKRIGLLTYLGQTSLDEKRENKIPWYLQKKGSDSSNKSSSKSIEFKSSNSLSLPGTAPSKPEDDKDEEKNSGQKSRMDPMSKVDEYFKKREHKLHKKHKKDHKKEHKKSHKKEKKSTDKSIEQLRAERLQRECSERKRTEQLLNKDEVGDSETSSKSRQGSKPRYNSQYMPHLSQDTSTTKNRNKRWKPY